MFELTCDPPTARLDAVFGGTKAIDITTTSVERYKTLRLKEKSAPATVNRELASLRRIFRLGLRQGMVATMPYLSVLAEHNVRKGFFELDQFQAILKYLGAEASVPAADFRPRDQVLRGGPETVDVEPEALGGLNGLFARNCLGV